MIKIALFGRSFKDVFIPHLKIFIEKINICGAELYIYEDFFYYLTNKIDVKFNTSKLFSKESEITSDFDYMFSFGGDGTFIEAVTFIKNKNIPIIGINTGRLGFLANISKEEIEISVEQILKKNYKIQERRLIEFSSENNPFSNFPFSLNEVTIQKKGTSMITVNVNVNDEYLNSYWTDGLIISTPTGSTAYSMSVGGPIVSPNCRVLLISPIASHNLSVRPIVINDDNEISIEVESRDADFLVTVDSRTYTFNTSENIKLKVASFSINCILLDNHDFYSTIRNKLLWGIDKRN